MAFQLAYISCVKVFKGNKQRTIVRGGAKIPSASICRILRVAVRPSMMGMLTSMLNDERRRKWIDTSARVCASETECDEEGQLTEQDRTYCQSRETAEERRHPPARRWQLDDVEEEDKRSEMSTNESGAARIIVAVTHPRLYGSLFSCLRRTEKRCALAKTDEASIRE